MPRLSWHTVVGVSVAIAVVGCKSSSEESKKNKKTKKSKKGIYQILQKKGFPPSRYVLKPFELLADWGPAGAFDSVACYTLVDKTYHRQFDTASRNWRPVLVVGDEVLVGPSPKMFTRLLRAAGYFDRAKDFKDMLVFQLHGFALDFYNGYRVRAKSLERSTNKVTIRGRATIGAARKIRSLPFATTVVKGKTAEFVPGSAARLEGPEKY